VRPLRDGFVALELVVLLSLSFPRLAASVCLRPHPRVCSDFFRSDAVFVGTVISVRAWPMGEVSGWCYRIKVTRWYRGSRRESLDVFAENSSARFPLEKGHSYLLFAYKEEGRLTIDNCGNSAEISHASKAIEEIESLTRTLSEARTGDIRGRITETSPDDPGVSGVSVVAHSDGKRYVSVTDREGWFHIEVPGGTYVVTPETSAWSTKPYDLSYDAPQHVRVPNGGCTELYFLALRK
jgi:hypothetical protein